ncbi:MAG: hypothetical protein WA642_06290 [Steroidobacteraceae bacterium]
MLRRPIKITIGISAAIFPFLAFGQTATAPQLFAVCASQANLPTVYFSGVLQGTKQAFAGFQGGFTEFLAQHYAYKGNVACLPTNSAANAQNFINTRSTALRNAKKIVVGTGWTQGAVAAAPVLNATVPPATATPTAAKAAPSGSGSSTGGASQLTSALGNLFGTGGGSGSSSNGCGATAASGAKSGAAASSTGAGCQSPFSQVSTTLAGVFGKSANAAAGSASAPKKPPSSAADGVLGSAQTQNTKLLVYGCGRQDTQVACVTDLGNQNQKDTLVQAADVWKDAFIVDDRGDRHPRTAGFFLNIDGDQRPQLDISFGKSARFVLMFDGVQTKVQKVALRSATGGLDVEEITLIDPNAGAKASPQH